MKPAIIALFAIMALGALVAGFTIMQTTSDTAEVPLTICTDRNFYSTSMDVTVGIGLTPSYPPAVDNGTVSFRWQTDYGNFLSWKSPDFRVIELGTDLTTDDGKIYQVAGGLAANKNEKLVPHMAHTVEITGDVMEMNGKMMIHADTLKMVSK
jgi:hypothetical protein